MAEPTTAMSLSAYQLYLVSRPDLHFAETLDSGCVCAGQPSWAARLDTNKADPALAAGQDDEADEELQKALQVHSFHCALYKLPNSIIALA